MSEVSHDPGRPQPARNRLLKLHPAQLGVNAIFFVSGSLAQVDFNGLEYSERREAADELSKRMNQEKL